MAKLQLADRQRFSTALYLNLLIYYLVLGDNLVIKHANQKPFWYEMRVEAQQIFWRPAVLFIFENWPLSKKSLATPVIDK
jgi:hypothetical protein